MKILTKRGYTIKKTTVHWGGVGRIYDFPRSSKLQIGCADLFGRAYCVIFDPIDHIRTWDLNNKSRWGHQKLMTELTEEDKKELSGKELQKLMDNDYATY